MNVSGIDQWKPLLGQRVKFVTFEPHEPYYWWHDGILTAVHAEAGSGDFHVEGDWGLRLVRANETVQVLEVGE